MERWKINLYIIWFSQILSLMSFGFGSPFLPYYIQELGVTEPDKIKLYTGILSAVTGAATGLVAPIWGMMSDRWGRKLMLLRAMLCASAIIAGMGLATRVEHLIVLRLAQGIFTGTVAAAAILVASGTPSNSLSYALGFLSSSTFIGYSIGPAIGGFIAEYVGYRTSFYIGGILMLFDFFLVLFFVKEDKSQQPQSKQKIVSDIPLTKVFTPVIIIMLVSLLFAAIARNAFGPYLPLYVQEMRSQVEGTARITGVISGIVGLFTALSGMVLGRLGDRHNKLQLLMVLITIGIVISLPMVFIGNLWIFTVVYSLFFFAIGSIEPLITSLNSENTPPERRGILFGVQCSVSSLAFGISPILSGAVSIKYSLKEILLITPIFLLLAMVPIFIYAGKNRRILGL